MNKSIWITLGLIVGAIGVLGGQFILNNLNSEPSSSQWIIPQTAFGEYDIQPNTTDIDVLYGNEIYPSFIEELDYYDVIKYGNDYIVNHWVQQSLIYNGETYIYIQHYLSIISSTGVFLWTHEFEVTDAYALAVSLSGFSSFRIFHMEVEGDVLYLITRIRNFITYFDPVTLQDVTVNNGNAFNIYGASEGAKQFIQSMVLVNLVTKTFHAVGVNEADYDVYDNEDFVRVGPNRYALAQEFDNDDYQAFSHVYYGETLTFTEQTNSIALLSEVTFHPTQLSVSVRTIGKWSSTGSIDIDTYRVRSVKGDYVTVEESGHMEIDVSMTLENIEGKNDANNNLISADDDLLTNTQQTFIDNASSRYNQDENMERLQYHIIGVLDKDFNKVSVDIYEEIQYITSNYLNLEVQIYWIKAQQFVFVVIEEEFNDGLIVSGNSVVNIQNGDALIETYDFEDYGEIVIYEFFMDDAGNMIVAGSFISRENNPIRDYTRTFVLLMNEDFQILDELIIDGIDVSNYLIALFIDQDQLRIYLSIEGQTGLFEGMDINTWIVLLTLPLV